MSRASQPRLSANDWRPLSPPAPGEWEPRLSVTIICAAYQPHRLAYVLAALAAQSYPDHLTEVIVVDDHSDPPIELPEILPPNTRLLKTEHGRSKADACRTAIAHSDGEVLHFLDSDMVADHHEVEAHLRWHHLIDYAVVLGFRTFVPADALDAIGPAGVRDRVATGTDLGTVARGPQVPQEWSERILAETEELATAGPRAMRLHVGMSTSVTRDLFEASKGLPEGMDLGEDIAFGYNLREAGAVFIPDRDASSLHLGESNVMRRPIQINRFNHPYLAQLVPEYRGHRLRMPRSYQVPYAEIVLPVDGVACEDVCAAVDAQLTGSLPDVVVTLVADWRPERELRHRGLEDPLVEQRLVRATYAHEERIRLVTEPAEQSEATFRVTLPGTTVFPAGRSLEQLLRRMELAHLGCVDVDLGEAGTARVLRTAAHARARRTSAPESGYEEALSAAYPVERVTAQEAGFVAAGDAPQIKQVPGLVQWGVKPWDAE